MSDRAAQCRAKCSCGWCCRQRRVMSPASLPEEWRHQTVDADSGRVRVHRAGQVQGGHRSRGAWRTALCHRRWRAEDRDAEQEAGPRHGVAVHAVVTAALSAASRAGAARSARCVGAESRAEAARSRRGGHGGRGGGEASGEEGGREEQGGERSVSRPAGAAAGPRQHRSPTSCMQASLQVPGAGDPLVTGGTNRPIDGGEGGRERRRRRGSRRCRRTRTSRTRRRPPGHAKMQGTGTAGTTGGNRRRKRSRTGR